MRIDLQLDFDLPNQKDIECKKLYIELEDNFIGYKHEIYAKRKGEDDVWREQYENLEERYMKRFVAGTSIGWVEKGEVWKIEIEIAGVDIIFVWFKKQSEAIKLRTAIEEWLLKL